MRNLEEKEIKQFSEFTEVAPESSQNLITDKGRFTVGALYNAVINYATGLINAAVNSAVSGVQDLCNSAASEAVESVEETIAAAAENAAAEAAALAEAAKDGAEAAKTAAETAKSGAETAQAAAETAKGTAETKAGEASESAAASAADKTAVQTLKTEVQTLKNAAELAAAAAQTADAGKLLLAKAHAPQLHFCGGTLAVPTFANFPVRLPISLCVEYDVDSWEGLGSENSGVCFFNSWDVDWAEPVKTFGLRLFYFESGRLEFGIGNNANNGTSTAVATIVSNKILPAGRHTIVACCGASITDGAPDDCGIYLDGIKLSSHFEGTRLVSRDLTASRSLFIGQKVNYASPTVGGATIPIRLSRAKIFNFLVDSDGAPYTLEDYISGREESPVLRQCAPGLHFENDSSKFPTVSTWGNGTAAYDGSEIVVSGFDTSNWSLLACTFPEPIAAGSRVRVKLRFESGSSASYNCFLYETSSSRLSMGVASDGADFEWEGLCPYNAAHLYIQASAASWDSAEYKLVSSSVEVLGPVLSLADSADGSVVRDLSGAANHAVIGGTVAARQNIPALAPQKISWAGTATAQNVCGEKGAPADSLVTIYARASSAVSLSVKCATNAAASKDLTAGVWTLCGSWTVPTVGAIVATPSAAFTGSIEFNVKIERFK